MLRWQEEQPGSVRCFWIRWRSVGSSGEGSGRAVLASAGGSGILKHSSRDRINLPRSVADDETGWAWLASRLMWPSRPRRGLSSGCSVLPNPARLGAGIAYIEASFGLTKVVRVVKRSR